MAAYISGRDTLRKAGPSVERVIDEVVVRDFAPAGFAELELLRIGLTVLQTTWTASRKARAR